MERSIRNLGDPIGSTKVVGLSDKKEDDRRPVGSRMNPYYLENGKAVYMGKGFTGIRSLQRKH